MTLNKLSTYLIYCYMARWFMQLAILPQFDLAELLYVENRACSGAGRG
jgi:hypothetical protein